MSIYAGVSMRKLALLSADVLLVALATLFAFLLRYNLDLSFTHLISGEIYIAASFIASLIIIPTAGLNRSIWRFSSLPDYVRILGASAGIVFVTVAMAFAYNRLDGVARSLPIIQGVMVALFMVGARVLYRVRYLRRHARKVASSPLRVVADDKAETILIVGLSRLTEMYLQSIAELAGARVHVAGLLGLRNRHVGRLAAAQPILGLAEDVERVLQDLEVHGTTIDRIVVTTTFDALSNEAQEALLRIDRGTDIQLQFLARSLGLERDAVPHAAKHAARAPDETRESFAIPPDETLRLARRPYWKVKRTFDILLSGALLIVLSPAFVLVAALVGLTIGFPVLFWQRRPGLGGRPFHLYKFRTLSAALDRQGRIRSDEERMSRIGSFLRRTRLDELPQLINILRGDMSFVGPRPLLPRDQSDAFRARLLVRPGLTGWAQVIGGRAITAKDKAALDVWYVKHATLALDLSIALRTIPMVVLGERIDRHMIARAWQDLRAGGIIQRGEHQPHDNELKPARGAAS